MGQVIGGDPTYHAGDGETADQAVIEACRRRLPFVAMPGRRRVRLTATESQAELAARVAAAPPLPPPPPPKIGEDVQP